MKTTFITILTGLVVCTSGVLATDKFPALDTPLKITSTTNDNYKLTIGLTVGQDGNVTSLSHDLFYFFREFAHEESIAMDEYGFYKQVPTDRFTGHCKRTALVDDCLIHVYFTEEEITTLYIHFDSLFQQDNKWITHGIITESHSDQGMTSFYQTGEF